MVMALMLTGAAMAGEMHYKVYGKAHVSMESLNNGEDSSFFISSNSTRLGVKGKYETEVEALTVIFQYESFADFNGEHGNSLSSRNSYVGVMGNWGKVIWGRHDTPIKSLGRSVDFFGDRIGDGRNVTRFDINYMDDSDRPMGFDERVTDMIMYKTPKLAESVVVALQYMPEEGKDSYMSLFSGSAVYDKDAFMVGVGYEMHDKGYFGYTGAEGDETDSSNIFRAVAGYTAEKFAVKGLFQTVSNIGGDKDISGTAFGLGASFMAAPAWELKGQYYMMDVSVDNVDPEPEDLGNAMLALGVDFHLNKSALLYVAYAMSMNQDNAYNTPFRGGHGQDYRMAVATGDDGNITRLGESPYGIAIGMIAKW
jgi:predicted porin